MVIVCGLLGVVTQFGQGWLHGSWNTIANSGAVWLLGAFVVGSLMPSDRWAAVAGAGTLRRL